MQTITQNLISKNIRPSFQRIKILEYLINNRIHPTVEAIYSALIKEIPTLSKSTIYNTMNLFLEANLVRELTIEDNEVRYDINTLDHGHFKCDKCGKIYDFFLNNDDLKCKDLSGFTIKEKNVYYRGICPKCLSSK